MFSIHHSGSNAILLRFKQEISSSVHSQVLSLEVRLKQAFESGKLCGIEELVSAYASLLIYFDPLLLNIKDLFEFLEDAKKNLQVKDQASRLCLELPCCYDEEFGLDLDFVCRHCKLSKKELVALHSEVYYLVYMLGFMAGFAYLGGLDKRLFTPRLKEPRAKIQAGSIGIADRQTGIYPISSPAGWQIIAKTPLKLFDKTKKDPTLLKPSMLVKFKPIDRLEFKHIEEEIKSGVYKERIYEYKGD
ncbi:5-oxoprolinase subunit PxpB [Campylobacter troglodytis]|uniref:5-oxoprolinase subunit PxpB n=1 Tax=Campylobacter troglodytis TaxID=654363 RepID=UPI00115AE607|nr:5-oxoprolinase subunit PxpB [Campylobacter troglodytis]TQR60244.1 allophanate hydrolase [Campylobacter troglodytis]